ncbi:MAG: SRPBCC domain-containing protein [Solirubrobacterales bacterium]
MSTPEQPWADSQGDAAAAPSAAVHVTRELAAPRNDVFRAWTQPDLFARWFTPPGNSSVTAELDVRPGGDYRIKLERTQLVPGTSYIVGRYLEVDPPERLVFTFGWEDPPPMAGIEALETLDSRVTVQFRDRGESTEISITHERLETAELRGFHRWGWETTLEQLAGVV